MAVKLYRCGNTWAKFGGIRAGRCRRRSTNRASSTRSSQARGRAGRAAPPSSREPASRSYPAIQFEDGSWYREQSKDMAHTIREGR